ncbi:MAG: LysM peptidoglycan-binding domain-containing protein [Glutamicibacter arilaitensis]|uniref:LysM peptidoglycan-binding domain-containing protein n=1 Tax=Glutamicibacter arilaitensis TaxID=256701 RepID=UPI003FB9631D
MSRQQRILIFALFTAASLVISYVGVAWIAEYIQTADNSRSITDRIKLLLSVSLLSLLMLHLLRLALARLIRWAFTHKKRKLSRLFQRIAPGLSKKVLGSLLGTSIALSSTTGAYAIQPVSIDQAQRLVENHDHQLANFPNAQQASVPSPQWFPDSMSIPIDKLVSPGATNPRQRVQHRPEVVVAPGQNLWSIAADHLGVQATAEEISAYWPKIYQQNKKSIGTNPDLLPIGTVLELPPAH